MVKKHEERTDRVEEAVHLQLARLLGLDVLDHERLEEVAVALALGRHGL